MASRQSEQGVFVFWREWADVYISLQVLHTAMFQRSVNHTNHPLCPFSIAPSIVFAPNEGDMYKFNTSNKCNAEGNKDDKENTR